MCQSSLASDSVSAAVRRLRSCSAVSSGAVEGAVAPAASIATHATAYITMKLINLGTDATGTTVIATASTSQTGGSAVAANVAFPLTITAANATVADGETLAFVRDEATTDASTSSNTVVVVRYIPVGPTS